MRNLRMLYLIPCFFIFISAPSLRAQTGDWQTLQNIPTGTKIKITLKHRLTFGYCFLDEVTDDYLSCGAHYSPKPFRYRRENIKAVYLSRRVVRTGFLIGAGAGVALGTLGRTNPGWNHAGQAMFDAAVLGGFGAVVGWVLDPWVHGRLIYRSP